MQDIVASEAKVPKVEPGLDEGMRELGWTYEATVPPEGADRTHARRSTTASLSFPLKSKVRLFTSTTYTQCLVQIIN